MNKKQLFEQILSQLEKNLETLVKSALDAKEASTNEESKAENKYDTRGLEASYLASGQAQRAKELEETIFHLKKVELNEFKDDDPAGVSALVQVSVDSEEKKWFFLLPAAGTSISSAGSTIQTLSLDSPLGKNILNLRTGDSFEFNQREYEILSVK